MKIPLTLEKRNEISLLDGKVMLESIDCNMLKKFINEPDLLNKIEIKQNDFYTTEFTSKFYESEKEQLQNYEKLIKYGKAFVRYDKTKGLNGFGRVIPQKALGLFSFRKQIRGALAYNHYVDVDIVNCHPVLLLSICESNEIECKYLKKYVENRDKYLNMVMTEYDVSHDDAKCLFIRLLYFGSFKTWANDYNVIKPILSKLESFKDELRNIGTILTSHNPELVEIIKKKNMNKKKNNITGSVVSFILQEWEYRILETIYVYCTETKIIKDNCVLCADGLMIDKKQYNPDLLIKFNELIKNKLGFDLTFIKKELCTDFIR